MDWKLFPPTQASFYNQELSQKNRVSLEQLYHNLDALLKRDTTDCLSKQLNGLVHNNARVYRIKPRFLRQQKIESFDTGDFGKTSKCYSVKENYCNQSPVNLGTDKKVYKPLESQSKSNSSHDDNPSSASCQKQLCLAKEPAILRQISRKCSSGKKRKKTLLQLTSEGNCNGRDVLPSNGWWRKEDSSDSETETEAGIKETDGSTSFNLEMKNDEFEKSCMACASPKGSQVALFGSHVFENNRNDTKMQARANSCPSRVEGYRQMKSEEQSGTGESRNFFQSTSGDGNEEAWTKETLFVPGPPQTTPIPGDETCQTCSEDNTPLCFSRSLILDSAIFDDNYELDYGDLLRHRRNTTSRINYNTLETTGYNYASPNKGCIIKEGGSKRSLENRNKILCVLPKVNLSKANKTAPIGFPEKVVKRRPNTANVPVKLRLQHRHKSSAKLSGKVTEENGTDERVLPTTLNKSADASYSIMTPYMANIVWSVMEDEKVL